MIGLIITLGLGLFIVLGAGIVFLSKNNQKFIDFTLSLAFTVMLILLVTDLFPEAYELVGSIVPWNEGIFYIIGSVIGGFLVLLLLDQWIPDHEDEPDTKKEVSDNLVHIGLVSSIALVLHNVIEGMAIYMVTQNNIQAGIMASVGVGLHNIPLGMVIASTFYQSNKNRKKTMGAITAISLSTFIGGFIVYCLNVEIPVIVEAMTLALTSGMLIYIMLMELLPKMIHTKNKKEIVYGFILGFLLLLVTLFI